MALDLNELRHLEGAVHDRRHAIARKLRTFAKNPAGRNYLARERQVEALNQEVESLEELSRKLSAERTRLLQPLLAKLRGS